MNIIRTYRDSFAGLSAESWMLSIVMFINRSGSMVLPFLGVYMTDALHFSIEQSGLVLSFYGIGAVVGSWVGGMLTDKFDEYRVQAFSLFLSVPLFLMIPLFDSIYGMLGIIFAQSVITELFRPANSVAITKYAKKGNITRSFSLNRMAVNLGFSVGPALGGILSTISYEFLFISNAVAVFFAGVVYVKFFRKRHLTYLETNPVAVKNTFSEVRSPYKDGPFMWFSFLCIVFSIFFFQLLSTIPLFFQKEAEFTTETIGYILGYTGVFLVIFEMLLVNFVDKHYTLAKILFVGALLAGISLGMLSLGTGIVLIIVAMTLLSVAEILAFPFMSTIAAERADDSNRGAYMGLNGISFSVAFIVTPVLGTWVAGEYGFNALWIGSLVILTLTAFALYQNVHKMLPGK